MIFALIYGFIFAHAASSASSLEARVRVLELELETLRARVIALEAPSKKSAEAVLPASKPRCVLRTPFDGEFSAESESAALAACKAKAKGGIYCRPSDVHCE